MSEPKETRRKRKKKSRRKQKEEDLELRLEDARQTVDELEKEVQELRDKIEKQGEFTFKVGILLSECIKEAVGMDELMETIVNREDPSMEKFISAATTILYHLKEKKFMITSELEEHFLTRLVEALDNMSLTEKGCEFLLEDHCTKFRDLVLKLLQIGLDEMHISQETVQFIEPESDENLEDESEIKEDTEEEGEEEKIKEEREDAEKENEDAEEEGIEDEEGEGEETEGEPLEEEKVTGVKKPLGELLLVPLLDMMANLLETEDGQFMYLGKTDIYKVVNANLAKDASEDRKKIALRMLETLSYQLEDEEIAMDMLEILKIDKVKVHLKSTDSEARMFAQTVMDNVVEAVMTFEMTVPGVEIPKFEDTEITGTGI